MQPTDEQLMDRVVARDGDALESLYDRYAATVMGVIFRIVKNRDEAEELVQEAFWHVWRQCHGFDPDSGSFYSWLFAISRNLALDKCRPRRVQPLGAQNEYEDVHIEQSDEGETSVVEAPWVTIRRQQVHQAMTKLPPEQYQVITMAYFDGKTRREIAEETETTLETVHTRARLGLNKLRQMLGGPKEEEV